jgi:hypothetical protein
MIEHLANTFKEAALAARASKAEAVEASVKSATEAKGGPTKRRSKHKGAQYTERSRHRSSQISKNTTDLVQNKQQQRELITSIQCSGKERGGCKDKLPTFRGAQAKQAGHTRRARVKLHYRTSHTPYNTTTNTCISEYTRDTLAGRDRPTPHHHSVVAKVGSSIPCMVGLLRRKERELGERIRACVNPSVFYREATFGYGNDGGRPPRSGKPRVWGQ